MLLPCWQDEGARQHKKAGKEGEIFGSQVDVEPAELFVSVVVPAYNEQDRLTGMLAEAVNYLEDTYGEHQSKDKKSEPNGKAKTNGAAKSAANGHAKISQVPRAGWEIVIVSDGSTDKTEETAFEFARNHILPLHPRKESGPWSPGSPDGPRIPPGSVRVVSLAQNRGKGGAVTHGMRHVRGEYVVFADADGASKFEDLGKLVTACQKAADSDRRAVAVGSRAHLVGSEAVVKVCISIPRAVCLSTLLMLRLALQASELPHVFFPPYPTRPNSSSNIPHP